MIIAIHARARSFSDYWIDWCHSKGIEIKLVDCYRNDIIDQLRDCDGLMWHWSHSDAKAAHFARALTRSLELSGIRVFPNSDTSWHYDDKVGQKYLLEAIGAPIVPSHVFYDRIQALNWAESTSYSKVFKLTGGAGSSNVRLATSKAAARRWIRRSFGRGWPLQSRFYPLREALWHVKRDRNLRSLYGLAFGFARIVVRNKDEQAGRRERGYAYFQDFIPGNAFDIRVVVIGRRCFAIKRGAREGDFRASGSGLLSYNPEDIPLSCVEIAFSTAAALRSQCLAFDFVLSKNGPLIVETSYAFTSKAYHKCPGFWDDRLQWNSSPVIPEDFMIEDFLAAIRGRVS